MSYSLLIEKPIYDCQKVISEVSMFLCMPFIWRSLHFLGKFPLSLPIFVLLSEEHIVNRLKKGKSVTTTWLVSIDFGIMIKQHAANTVAFISCISLLQLMKATVLAASFFIVSPNLYATLMSIDVSGRCCNPPFF